MPWGKLNIIFSLFHNHTDSPCLFSLSLTSIFVADPRAPIKACSYYCAVRTVAVAVLLLQTRGQSSPHRGVPPNHSLVPRHCCHRVEQLFAKSTGLDKVFVDAPVPSPDPNPDVSGMWVGSNRGHKTKIPSRPCDKTRCCSSRSVQLTFVLARVPRRRRPPQSLPTGAAIDRCPREALTGRPRAASGRPPKHKKTKKP